ncbi:O-antigen ligase family protein [Streptomyces roseicoloratus]|uniref:O-antigen ligase family protein n=1 Tax=Streptomyces roseicoloratus TaxID=2508722 RepID=A0ABY9S280_9ACTN|nr:O-antigen ligase family protein [Streptomyces roseicoloratus]WMX48347.1 O-antigen ligase family protein [Streptomyces roseicoloratus]
MTWTVAGRNRPRPVTPRASRPDRRVVRTAGVAVLAALAFGALLPGDPLTAVGALVVIPLAFGAPVAALSVLIAITVLVPFEAQDRFSLVGGSGRPGLLLVDVLMLLGLCRVGWLVATRRLRLDRPLLVASVVGLVLVVALGWGVAQGADVSEAGHETRRVLLGVGAFVLAWPVVRDPAARHRLEGALVGLGLALGIWGLVQWGFSIDYTSAADVGIRRGVDLTSAGRGSLQGGLYAYPVAVTLALAALVSGRVRSVPPRWLLAAVVCLNAVCLWLTYERTFWVATAVACAVVVLLSGARARRSAAKWVPVGAGALLLGLAVLAPGEIRTALERVVSVNRLEIDESYSYRVIESRVVLDEIQGRPLTGSGFGATITWGEEDTFTPLTTPFIHNGYLWLAWKIGVPAAVFLVSVLVAAVLRRGTPGEDPRLRVLRTGSRAALLSLLLTTVTFPAFNTLGVTAVIGLLVAVCFCGRGDDVASAERPRMRRTAVPGQSRPRAGPG